jgi:uncharacterized protein YdaU (DUF1376 family)
MAKDKADIWMPVYIGDYFADTMHLTAEQHGAYLLLLFTYWKRRKPLPNDNAFLSNAARLSTDAWSIHRAVLEEFFDTSSGNAWVHHRVEQELEKAGEKKQKAVEKAKKAAESRWGNATSNATSINQAMLEQCPSPSPSPIKDIPPDPQGGGGRRKVKIDETPYEQIRQSFETHLPMLPQPKPVDEWTDGRKSQVRARHTEKKGKADFWDRYFSYVAKSAFLTGNTPENFEARLDWLIKPANMQKVCEGNYHKVLNHG